MPKTMVWILTITVLVTAGCATVSSIGWLERNMVFQPAKYPAGDWTPGGTEFEDAAFQAADGTKLHGWYAAHPNPQAVILYCHGNAGNLSHRAQTVRDLRNRHRASVLVFDYRGYGRSEGTPNEAGLVLDARAARDWLQHRTGLETSDITLLGHSLGGGVAVQLAADDGARGLVLVSTFTSLPDVGAHHMPLLSPRLVMRNRFASEQRLPEYDGSVLICHGDRDEVVPFEMGQRLYEVANEPKQFVKFTGGTHNDPLPQSFHDEVSTFLAALPPLPAVRSGTATSL